MKEDLIVIPEMDVFETLIADARSDLSELDVDNEELGERRELALDVVGIIEEKVKESKDSKKIGFKDKIWFAAHLHLLETILEDLFEEDEDLLSFEDEEEEK